MVQVTRQYVLGQKSYPVNQLGLQYGKKPISHNYRMISEIAILTIIDNAAFIKVGAMFVNSIKLTNTTDAMEKRRRSRLFFIWFNGCDVI